MDVQASQIVQLFDNRIDKGLVLDLGMGNAHDLAFLSKAGREGIGYDKDPKCVNNAKAIAERYNLPITFEVLDIRNLNFPMNKFVAVIAVNILNYLKRVEIDRIAEKIVKALVPGGLVIIQAFNLDDNSAIKSNNFDSFKYWFKPNDLQKIFSQMDLLFYAYQVCRSDCLPSRINMQGDQYRGTISFVSQKRRIL